MTNQELIEQKVSELLDLCDKQMKEQESKDYKGKTVSCFIAVGHHSLTGDDNSMQGIAIGDRDGLYSCVRTTLQQSPPLATIIHDAACGLQQQRPADAFAQLITSIIAKQN